MGQQEQQEQRVLLELPELPEIREILEQLEPTVILVTEQFHLQSSQTESFFTLK
jgi:hypothetical protein